MKNTYHILHLDDNPAYTQMINILLSSHSAKGDRIAYTACQQAKQAEGILAESLPDLFICDLMLDNHNEPSPGVELLKKIGQKEQFKTMKLMALTANLEAWPKKELANIVDQYQMKDFSPNQFADDVLSILRQKVSRRVQK